MMLHVLMRYYENGNLYSYLVGILCWRDIVDMLWAISAGLNFIHERDLVHGHLHGGNKTKWIRLMQKSRTLPVDKQMFAVTSR